MDMVVRICTSLDNRLSGRNKVFTIMANWWVIPWLISVIGLVTGIVTSIHMFYWASIILNIIIITIMVIRRAINGKTNI
jgi:hypothetical protein